MANQIVVSAGAKVRNLEGVLTGTVGVVSSLPINASNGIPQLDVNGKILVSQLPNSVMEYKGTWNAATNTPTLVNGTGNQGDVYLCNVAGTVNFGAGAIAFVVGDQVIYSGSIWQKASGATGTVTSVALTESGDSLNITGSPITTSGTINIGFNGTNLQYVNGAGNLTTFPILTGYVTAVSGTAPVVSSGGTTPAISMAAATASVDGYLLATDFAIFNAKQSALTFSSPLVNTSGTISIPAATTSVNGYLASADFTTFNNKQNTITLTTTGMSGASTLVGATLNIPNYGSALTGYVPYTGATQDVDLGAFKLNAQSLHAKGTGGLGHLGLKHQSASATASANEVSLFADSLGDLGWLNGNTYLSKFITSGNTAARSYTFPNATCNIPNDSLVVHLAGTETITGAKTFSGGVTFSSSVTTNNLTFANSGFFLTLQPPTLSVNRTVTLPNGTGTLALTSDISYPVTSVFGRTGAVVATSGDYNTSLVTENVANLYYTEARVSANTNVAANTAARHNALTIGTANGLSLSTQVLSLALATTSVTGALSSTDWTTFNNKQSTISLTTTGTSGAATFTANTLNIPNYGSALSGYLPLTGGTLTGALGFNSGFGTSTAAISIYNNTGASASNVALIDFRVNNSFGGNERVASISASNPNAAGNNGGQLNFLVSANGTGTTPTTGMYLSQDKSLTLLGALTGTSATFSGAISLGNNNTFPSGAGIFQGSNFLQLVSGSSGLTINNNSNTVSNFIITNAGAATFSSSVTATNYLGEAATTELRLRGGGYGGSYNTSLRSGTGAIGVLQFGNNNDNYILAGNTAAGGYLDIRVNCASESITAGTLALRLASTGAATFSSSGLFSGNLQTNAVLTIGNQGVAGNYCLNITPSTTVPISLQGILAGVGAASIVLQPSGGNVLIGTTTDDTVNKLQVNGGIYAKSSIAAVVAADIDMFVSQNTGATYTKAAIVASIAATGGTGSYFFYGQQSTSTVALKIFSNGNIQNTNNSYGAISDARLKENIKDATPKLDDLMKVKVRNYNLKGESNKQLGVISQELEAIFPNMIEESTNMGENMKIKGVKYSVFVPMLIKAVQEQQQQINELKQLLNK